MARILCIDDDQDILETYKSILQPEGHSVETAFDGEQGFAKIKTFKPDLIFLDVMMRDSTEGFHTAYRIRGDSQTKNIPILMFTSVNQKTNLNFNLKKDHEMLPVDVFLEKPVIREKVLHEVNRLLCK